MVKDSRLVACCLVYLQNIEDICKLICHIVITLPSYINFCAPKNVQFTEILISVNWSFTLCPFKEINGFKWYFDLNGLHLTPATIRFEYIQQEVYFFKILLFTVWTHLLSFLLIIVTPILLLLKTRTC